MRAFLFETGDPDEALVSTIPERDLYLSVFYTAIHDLMFSKNKLVRKRTIAWFEGAPAAITFEEIKDMFKFTESRYKKLDRFLTGEEKLERACKRKYFHSKEWTNQPT